MRDCATLAPAHWGAGSLPARIVCTAIATFMCFYTVIRFNTVMRLSFVVTQRISCAPRSLWLLAPRRRLLDAPAGANTSRRSCLSGTVMAQLKTCGGRPLSTAGTWRVLRMAQPRPPRASCAARVRLAGTPGRRAGGAEAAAAPRLRGRLSEPDRAVLNTRPRRLIPCTFRGALSPVG